MPKQSFSRQEEQLNDVKICPSMDSRRKQYQQEGTTRGIVDSKSLHESEKSPKYNRDKPIQTQIWLINKIYTMSDNGTLMAIVLSDFPLACIYCNLKNMVGTSGSTMLV